MRIETIAVASFAFMLMFGTAARAELRHVEIKTLGMD
jgi:hypothetical protein